MRPFLRPLLLFALVAAVLVPGPAFATTVPVQLTAPTAGSFVHGTIPVRATAPDADSVTFQRGRAPDGPFNGILPIDTTRADGWHVAWDTSGLADGVWYLRAKADAAGGPFFSDPLKVIVDNTAPVVTLAVSPSSFSPNGDGIKDRTNVALHLSEPGGVELDVVNAAHKVVHRLNPGGRLTAGTHRFDWGGLVLHSGHWLHAQDGVYGLRARVVDTAGNVGTATGALRIDTVAPGFTWVGVSPEPASGSGPVTLAFHSFDPGSSVVVSAAIWNAVQRVRFADGVTRPTGASSVQISPPASSPPGLYRARIVVADQAGNRTQSEFLPFRIQHPVTTTVVRGFTGVGNRIALTFDDCVFGDAWTSILNTLEARGLRATFFCASINLDHNAAEARRTIADGMSIGSHTRDHPDLTTLSYDQIRAQLQDDVDAWWRIARATPLPLFRPPYGAYNSSVLQAAGSLGFLHTVTWDVDPQDWSDPGVAAIRQRVLSAVHPGAVVVMHVKPETAAALPGLLDALAARGYQQTALDQMFRIASGTTNFRLGPPSWGRHGAG
jgi:peptidoglycan/xylan/chitin deacetylase (PgdA/CDA1 family)